MPRVLLCHVIPACSKPATIEVTDLKSSKNSAKNNLRIKHTSVFLTFYNRGDGLKEKCEKTNLQIEVEELVLIIQILIVTGALF